MKSKYLAVVFFFFSERQSREGGREEEEKEEEERRETSTGSKKKKRAPTNFSSVWLQGAAAKKEKTLPPPLKGGAATGLERAMALRLGINIRELEGGMRVHRVRVKEAEREKFSIGMERREALRPTTATTVEKKRLLKFLQHHGSSPPLGCLVALSFFRFLE